MQFDYTKLQMMPQEYFSALVYATSDGTAETFLAGVLHATGAPPPRSHPPPSLAAHWLGLIAEQVTITVPMLAALNLAESVEPPFQLPFLQGLYAAFCEAAPPDLLPKAVLQGDADTGTANTPAVYRGTVNGKVGYWREGPAKGDVTWFYSNDDLQNIGITAGEPGLIYISNHIQKFRHPHDAQVIQNQAPNGYVDVDTRTLYPFPSAGDTTERWQRRTSAVIDNLMSRGGHLNTDLKQQLATIKVTEHSTKRRRGTCAMCRFTRTLTHSAILRGALPRSIGSQCATRLEFAIRLARVNPGSDPTAVLDDLHTVL